MNERIKEIRLYFGLTQVEFGRKIGVKQSAVTGYENGNRQPLDNEEWLRTGEGPQFIEITRAEQIQQMVDDIMRDHPEAFRRRFVTALAGLDDKGWIALENFIDSITDQEDIDQRKKLHDDLDRQLSEEEAHADESGASQAM